MGNRTNQPYFSRQQGLRALHVWENSPAAKAGIIPFIDFIIGIKDSQGNEPIIQCLKDFITLLQSNENQDFEFFVLNIFTQKLRTITINLNKNWPNANSVLGIIFRYENYEISYNNIMKVTNIEKNSPAEQAGLIKNEDFILGISIMKLESQNEFSQIIKDCAKIDQQLSICVYNSAKNTVSHLQILPNNNWEGKGNIGCELSQGFLNQLTFEDNNILLNIKYGQILNNF